MAAKGFGVVALVALALSIAACGGGPSGPESEQSAAAQSGERPPPTQGETSCPTPGNPNKLVICHIPPGNPDNSHEICVDDSAVPAHLAHGDFLGKCPVCKPNDPYYPYCCPPDDPYCDGGSG